MAVVTVLLFARAREQAGTEAVRVEVSGPHTVAAVRSALRHDYPALAPLIDASGIAVNHDFADDARAVLPGDEVALIPPVSGG